MSRFVHEVQMRWSDMDAFRHVNNSAYLVYLEQARVAMFFDRHESFARGVVIARHEIDYLAPIVYHPEPLRLELWVDGVRGAAFTVRYEVFDGSRLTARAATVCVPFDFDEDRPRRLTDEERAALAGYRDDSTDLGGADGAAGRAGMLADRGR
jgi:acyl-CoA thioester hydrolase